MKNKIIKMFKSIDKILPMNCKILYLVIILYGLLIIIINNDIKAKIIGGTIVFVISLRIYFKIYS